MSAVIVPNFIVGFRGVLEGPLAPYWGTSGSMRVL